MVYRLFERLLQKAKHLMAKFAPARLLARQNPLGHGIDALR
jgi:hypothetical protein